MALFTYSARALWLHISNDVFNGGFGHDITGYAPDEFLVIETEDDDWTTEEGADGQVVRSMIPNAIAKMTLTLQQTSPTNDLLTRLHACGKGFDKANAIGADIFTFTLAPPAGAVPEGSLSKPIFTSSNCYISKIAPMNYAKESGTRSWEITAVDGIFGSDTLANVVQGVGGLVRDIGELTNYVR